MSSDWKTPNDVKQTYANASILKDSRIVFILMLNKNRKIINNLPFIRKIFFNDKERLFAFSLPLNERFSNTKAN